MSRLQDPLPEGNFDLVVSALAVHHLDGAGKADLFARVADRLRSGGRFVLGDVVVPDDPADVVTPIDGVYDQPSTIAEQVQWLVAAGFHVAVVWTRQDLCVIVADSLSSYSSPEDDRWPTPGHQFGRSMLVRGTRPTSKWTNAAVCTSPACR